MLPCITQPFSVGYWGFTFGLTALANAPIRMIDHGDRGVMAYLAFRLFADADVAIAILAIGTIYPLIAGRLPKSRPRP